MVTSQDMSKQVAGVNMFIPVVDIYSGEAGWATKAQPSESFDGNWDTSITDIYDWRIDGGDTVTVKVWDFSNNNVILAEGSYTIPGTSVNPNSASSLVGTAVAMVSCIMAIAF